VAFDSSYGEIEEGIRGATRAHARRRRRAEPCRAVPWRGEARRGVACVRACLVLSCLVFETRRDVCDVTHENQTRHDVAHAW